MNSVHRERRFTTVYLFIRGAMEFRSLWGATVWAEVTDKEWTAVAGGDAVACSEVERFLAESGWERIA